MRREDAGVEDWLGHLSIDEMHEQEDYERLLEEWWQGASSEARKTPPSRFLALPSPFRSVIHTPADLTRSDSIRLDVFPNARNSAEAGVYTWVFRLMGGTSQERSNQLWAILKSAPLQQCCALGHPDRASFLRFRSVALNVIAVGGSCVVCFGCSTNFSWRYSQQANLHLYGLYQFLRQLAHVIPWCTFDHKILWTCEPEEQSVLELERQLGEWAGLNEQALQQNLVMNQIVLGI